MDSSDYQATGSPASRYSTAILDSLVCPVLVDSKELQRSLPDGVSLHPLPGVPEGRHPIIIEIWRLNNGLIEIAGATAHSFWEHAGLGFGGATGAAMGAWLGSAVGAVNGAALGMWLGPLGWWWGATSGAVFGAAALATSWSREAAIQGSWAGRSASENEQRVVGCYNEVIVTVPCRRVRCSGIEDNVSLVLGCFTDSNVSRLGEWFFGWGFRKSRASGGQCADGSLELRLGLDDRPFKIGSHQAGPPLTSDTLSEAGAPLLAVLSRPLLGVRNDNHFVVSLLERFFENQAVRGIPASVQLDAGDNFVQGVPGLRAELQPLAKGSPWGAILLTGLPVALSFPHTARE